MLVAGQAVLIALGPLSRVGDPGLGSAGPLGIALLAPDSVGYLADASSWSGVVSEAWPRWGYLVDLRIGHLLGDAPLFAVATQVVAVVAGGVLLIRLGRELAGRAAGVIAAAMLLLNPMTAQWVRFVLTESLFYALAVAVTVTGARALADRGDAAERRSRSTVLLTLAAAAVAFRPTGPLLAGAAATLLALTRPGSRSRRVAGIVVVGLGTATLLLSASTVSAPAEGSLSDQLRAGVVIEGAPEVRVTVPMPTGPAEPVAYIAAEPAAVLRLAATRIAVEVAQVRRHYPTLVNVALGFTMVAIVGLAAVGLRAPAGRSLRTPTLVVLAPLIGIVGVTFAVPEGRYGWAGLVALSPAVGIGAAVLLDRIGPHPGTPAAR